MTLSNDDVIKKLNARFVCGTKNIMGEPYAGMSGAHETDDPAFYTTNGAGPHNMQLFMMDADGTVLNCLPGFWAPEDLLTEIALAEKLDKVWHDPTLSRAKKDALFAKAHLDDMKAHSPEMRRRSHLQGFDAKAEEKKETSDFAIKDGDWTPPVQLNRKGLPMGKTPTLKTTDQVTHERMAARPFVSYDKFDVAAFSNYGLWRYDKTKFDGSGAWPLDEQKTLQATQKKHKMEEKAAAAQEPATAR